VSFIPPSFELTVPRTAANYAVYLQDPSARAHELAQIGKCLPPCPERLSLESFVAAHGLPILPQPPPQTIQSTHPAPSVQIVRAPATWSDWKIPTAVTGACIVASLPLQYVAYRSLRAKTTAPQGAKAGPSAPPKSQPGKTPTVKNVEAADSA